MLLTLTVEDLSAALRDEPVGQLSIPLLQVWNVFAGYRMCSLPLSLSLSLSSLSLSLSLSLSVDACMNIRTNHTHAEMRAQLMSRKTWEGWFDLRTIKSVGPTTGVAAVQLRLTYVNPAAGTIS